MKLLKISLLLYFIFFTFSCGTSTNISNSWASPDADKIQIKGKIAVLVKIDDYSLRRNFEDKITQALKNNGFDAISSYNHFTKNDLNNEDALMTKVDQLGVGAALAIYPISEKVKNSYAPTISARVGVPVDFGLGPIFLGASVPIAGGSYSELIANLDVLFYIKDKNEAVYSATISGSVDDTSHFIKSVLDLVIDDLKTKKVIKNND